MLSDYIVQRYIRWLMAPLDDLLQTLHATWWRPSTTSQSAVSKGSGTMNASMCLFTPWDLIAEKQQQQQQQKNIQTPAKLCFLSPKNNKNISLVVYINIYLYTITIDKIPIFIKNYVFQHKMHHSRDKNQELHKTRYKKDEIKKVPSSTYHSTYTP